jgi:hypothetical protein
MAVGVPLTHRRILRSETLRWFTKDVGLPLAGTVVAAGIGRVIINRPLPPFETLGALVIILACSMASAALATPSFRAWTAAK